MQSSGNHYTVLIVVGAELSCDFLAFQGNNPRYSSHGTHPRWVTHPRGRKAVSLSCASKSTDCQESPRRRPVGGHAPRIGYAVEKVKPRLGCPVRGAAYLIGVGSARVAAWHGRGGIGGHRPGWRPPRLAARSGIAS